MWRFPKISKLVVPPNHPKLDLFSIENFWFWGSSILRNPQVGRSRSENKVPKVVWFIIMFEICHFGGTRWCSIVS